METTNNSCHTKGMIWKETEKGLWEDSWRGLVKKQSIWSENV